ncbi:metal transporter CNNM4-like protein [Dinothrombium tinctorium]|uniref:Metal transporter CNNM4-like protein n=1 Tax=Dinothrombium tinctorium TaxID=1965070 RepID=A0A3S3NKR2_9ACAR|nr:metal transporter CNNM4-like protein [Dinothrombium tinctorium]
MIDHTEPVKPKKLAIGVYAIETTFKSTDTAYFVCVYAEEYGWQHQGNKHLLTIKTRSMPPPFLFHISPLAALLFLSGLFSGLTIGLMTLDQNELQVLALIGNEEQKKNANVILPLRRRGNFLLCSLLLGNVLVNSIIPLIFSGLTSDLFAVILSTIAIVVIGEIIPQAICSRRGLVVGAKTIYITYLVILITSPISYPISKFLDWVFGIEIVHVYDRERLMEYIRITRPYNKLEEDELNIITGALELNHKTVGEVMTPLGDIFMIPITAKLNSALVSEIVHNDYSRIPVYDKEKSNVVALLYAKDIVLYAAEEQIPIEMIVKSTKHPLIYTRENKRLKSVFDEFKQGKCHMAFVKARNKNQKGIIGLITMEDVLEEILQSEILDETDIVTDKKQVRKQGTGKEFAEFLKIGEGKRLSHYISPQTFHAVFNLLSTNVKPFSSTYISKTVLRKILEQKVFHEVKFHDEPIAKSKRSNEMLYVAGQAADYFIMIIEGRVKVSIGKERLHFECRQFSYFGLPALELNADCLSKIKSENLQMTNEIFAHPVFIPEYTVQVSKENCLYMKISRRFYLTACKATILETQWLKESKNVSREMDTFFHKAVDSKHLGGTWIKTHYFPKKISKGRCQQN